MNNFIYSFSKCTISLIITEEKGGLLKYFNSYGWIFLLMMCIILAIFHFGLFSFGISSSLLCDIPGGFICKDPFLNEYEISFDLENYKRSPVEILSITFNNNECSSAQTFENPERLDVKGKQIISLTCRGFPRVSKAEIIIEFRNSQTGLTYKDIGTIKYFR